MSQNPYKPGSAMELMYALPPKLGAPARITALVLWELAKHTPDPIEITQSELRKLTKLTSIGQSNAVRALREATVLTADGEFVSPWLRDRRARLLPVKALYA